MGDLVTFNSSLVVLFLFAWRFWNDIHWKGWSVYSIATALVMMTFLTAFGFANHVGGPAGVMEKLATATRTLWSALLTAKLLVGGRLNPAAQGERVFVLVALGGSEDDRAPSFLTSAMD